MQIKPKKCPYCKEKYTPKYLSTEPCPKYDCRLKVLEAKKAKIEKKVVSIRKKAQKEAKEALIDYQKELQQEVQKIARFIDHKCLCLARNIVPFKKDGGHVYSRGSATNISLNVHNIFLQSAASNHFQNDDGLMRDGVVRVFGVEYLEFITALKRTPITKYTNEEYKEILAKARVVSRRLAKENDQLITFRNPEQRIELRNQINIELGIYPVEYCVFKKESNKQP